MQILKFKSQPDYIQKQNSHTKGYSSKVNIFTVNCHSMGYTIREDINIYDEQNFPK